MRTVTFLPILVFQLLLALPLAATIGTAAWLSDWTGRLPLGGLLLFVACAFVFLALTTLVFRLYLAAYPVPLGELDPDSPAQHHYFVYLLFWLMIYGPLLRLGIIPAPLSRLVMIALGARVGAESYSSGMVFDAQFVTIGSHTQLGIDCLLVPHSQEGSRLAHYPITIGDNVTIGGRSVIMAGVTIEDGAVVGFCSLVTKGSHIRAGEVWVGSPARPLRRTPAAEPGA